MTAILAARSKGRVYIASDRAVSLDNGQVLACGPKAIKVGGFVLALAGSIGGHWEALQEATPTTIRDLCDLVGHGPDAEAVAAQGPNLWLLSWEGSAETGRWGACLVNGPVALGSGGLVALGAYLARRGPVERRMREALALTAFAVGGVAPPFDVVRT